MQINGKTPSQAEMAQLEKDVQLVKKVINDIVNDVKDVVKKAEDIWHHITSRFKHWF